MAVGRRSVGVLAVLSVGGLLAGCSSSPSATAGTATTAAVSTTGAPATPATRGSTTTASSTTTTVAGPPCTQGAISAVAMNTPSIGQVTSVTGFGCSGSWAYADVVVGTTNSFDAVIVLQVAGANWTVANRATACQNHLVPAAIYTQACTTS